MNTVPSIKQVAFVGGHLPRQCGIATFTHDLRDAVARECPTTRCEVVAMTDPGRNYDYPDVVGYEIHQENRSAYRQAADYLNLRDIEVLSVQHEFGIYGGASGIELLSLLERVDMPVVATLHTILPEPSPDQRAVMHALARRCDRFVVMAEHGRAILEDVYDIRPEDVDVIPHGVIDVPFLDPEFNKERFGVLGQTVLLTFGLLSPNKGIEHAIEALPEIVSRHPDVVYVIAGVTHPHLRASEGEAYREMLMERVRRLGMEDHVKFENRFMDLPELTALIGASDIYITPYLHAAQITSGALSYAFGAGKAIVSTPYWHAEELLAEERGLLVPFRDPRAIAAAVDRYLTDSCLMTSVRKRAYERGRSMTWPHVARHYMDAFERALSRQRRGPAPGALSSELPALNFRHLLKMTGSIGMFQHAVHNVPNYEEGYCVDDNARAYLLCLMAAGLEHSGMGQAAFVTGADTYLAFLRDAFDPDRGRFRNFMSLQLEWLEQMGSDDSHGRALWALGQGVGLGSDSGHQAICAGLVHRGMDALADMTSPRAWAFGLLGLESYLGHCPGDCRARRLTVGLVGKLKDLFQRHATDDWQWFEPVVSYDNPRLCQALICSGLAMDDEQAVEIGQRSLDWLWRNQVAEGGWFSPVGCHGFWKKGGERARFDQQPLEAAAMVSACLQAHEASGENRWRRRAAMAAAWFTGANDLGVSLYEPGTGACRDGLAVDQVNANQGAESTLACQTALVEMRLAEQNRTKEKKPCRKSPSIQPA